MDRIDWSKVYPVTEAGDDYLLISVEKSREDWIAEVREEALSRGHSLVMRGGHFGHFYIRKGGVSRQHYWNMAKDRIRRALKEAEENGYDAIASSCREQLENAGCTPPAGWEIQTRADSVIGNVAVRSEDFYVDDAKGRIVGARVSLYRCEFVVVEKPTLRVWDHESYAPGVYLAMSVSATRDGKDFGGSQRERYFENAKERDAAAEKYLTDARKRAEKKFERTPAAEARKKAEISKAVAAKGLVAPGNLVKVERKDGGWIVGEAMGYPVDGMVIVRLVPGRDWSAVWVRVKNVAAYSSDDYAELVASIGGGKRRKMASSTKEVVSVRGHDVTIERTDGKWTWSMVRPTDGKIIRAEHGWRSKSGAIGDVERVIREAEGV